MFIGLRLAPRAPFHRGSCAVNPASACGGVTARGKFEKILVGDVKYEAGQLGEVGMDFQYVASVPDHGALL